MKITFLVVAFLGYIGITAAQNKKDLSDYKFVEGSGSMMHKSLWSEYLVGVQGKIIDIRNATPEQLKLIIARRKLKSLSAERFGNLYVTAAPDMFPRKSLTIRFDAQTKANVYRGNDWMWGTLSQGNIIIDGESAVEIADCLITPETAKNYRYRFITNDRKEMMGWKTPEDFRRTADGKYSYAYLGKIDYQPNQFVQIELYNINDYKDRNALIVDWRPVRQLKAWVIVNYKAKRNESVLLGASLGGDKKSSLFAKFIETDTLNDVKFRLGDSLIRMNFVSQHLATPYNYQMMLKKTIDGKSTTIDLGDFNKSFQLYKEFWNSPGKYEMTFTPLLIKYGGHEKNYLRSKTLNYKFTVLPELNPPRLFSSKELALIGVIICGISGALLAVIISRVKRKNQVKVVKAQQQKEMISEQLNAVRAQLNPHFMFNALAGIQSLMNKNEPDTANRYMGKFARITRNVLHNKPLITLEDEQHLLDDYLQMEQLRFGFNYQINTNKLDTANIEIPSMLLQPFVENAVKYGLSGNTSPQLTVEFKSSANDLLLSVTDNGNGFDIEKEYTGYGLQLTRNRITLLNKIHKENKITLAIQSGQSGTTVVIVLNQWL